MSVASSQYSGDLSDLHSKLGEQLAGKEKLEAKLELFERKLGDKEKELMSVSESRDYELQAKLDAEVKEKRSLRHKVGDVEAELERKEKQVKDVVERYSKEIAELEDRLADQTKAKENLQKDIDRRNDERSVDISVDTDALKDRIAALEKSVDVERSLARDAEKTGEAARRGA